MDKHIEEYLSHFLPELAGRGIQVSSQREITYGLQLRLSRDGEAATLNLYYSEKKGVTKVIGNSGNGLHKELSKLICIPEEAHPGFHSWQRWIGSDECGKGDYFGALVVAAFALDAEMAADLRSLGVADSKRLRDPQVKAIALQLYGKYNQRISCIVIKPAKYNEIIADMQSREQNLNDLLAWQHGTAILELLNRVPNVQGVLADQFSPRKLVKQYLISKEVTVPVEERHKAEADVAVAAASIIARYQFLQNRDSMERHYGMKFPLGSGKNVLPPAKAFADRHGWARLAEVAKLHFVTSRQVRAHDIFEVDPHK
jgi:ribonuclease HIII